MSGGAERLSTDWFDTDVYSGCIALSIVLPDYVPFQSVFPIRVVEDFFEGRGTGIAGIDDRWMTCPYVLMTKWMQIPWPIRPWLEDISIAEDALVKANIGVATREEDAPTLDPIPGQPRSVVIAILPVKSLATALERPAGKVDVITFVRWVLMEWMRAVRLSTQLPIQDLTPRRMPVAIPVRYADVVAGELEWHEQPYDMFSDEFVERTLLPPVAPHEVVESAGLAFGQLTWGRPGAITLDHIVRGDSAAMIGDDVGALLAYATACEVAIVNLSLALRWENGSDAADVARELKPVSVSSMVPSLCHSLGGNWSLDAAGPARSWFVDVARVRNRVIHAGNTPTLVQLNLARDAVRELMTHIAKRLVVKWKTHPRTLALLVSRESVDLYASKKSHTKVVETIETLAESSEEAFAAWRRRYLSFK